MKVIKQRLLRGPNLYTRQQCLLSIIQLDQSEDLPQDRLKGLAEGLLALLPTPRTRPAGYTGSAEPGSFAERLRGAVNLAEVIENLTLELQCIAGNQASFGTSLALNNKAGHYQVICAYQLEKLVEPAFALAVRMVQALLQGKEPEIAADLEALRQTAAQYAISASTAVVLEAAQKRGVPAIRISDEAELFQLGWGSGQKRIQQTMTGKTSHVAVGIAEDKELSKALLEQANIPVADGGPVMNADEAVRMLARLGGPVTVKPGYPTQGRGLTLRCVGAEQVKAAYEEARRHSRHVIVERFLEGSNYRVLVAGNRVVAAVLRKAPSVTGNGVSTIGELVEAQNAARVCGAESPPMSIETRLDDHALAYLAKQGCSAESVLSAGEEVRLRRDMNIANGGYAEDVTDLLPQETVDLCVRAAGVIGLDVAGIDLVCKDIGQPLAGQGGGIVAVNAAPDIEMHRYPTRGAPRDAGGAIIDSLFKCDDGRIPTVAVTGTNGKTTTSLLIAHTVRLTGRNTGVTTTEGIYINGVRTQKGDCTGYWSARSLLTSDEVDFAVLESARGGILKRGLGFDYCDVSVVLNVSDDHLGLDGVDTVEDLARVKGVVARAASRVVVLNADDRHCVAMASTLKPFVEVIYFSMDPDNPILLRHLAQYGRAAYLQDNELVIADGKLRHGLLQVETMPVTMVGHARYNIANALAAAAALMASEFSNAEIFAGLRSFVSDGINNPLRSNFYQVRGVTVVVDYAHNPAACEALAAMARSYSSGRVVGVITAPGDRQDAALRKIGRTCGTGFDEIVVYESDQRGRAYGETSELVIAGAREVLAAHHTHAIPVAEDALRFALSRCSEGDILVFECATSVSQLVDALRDDDPVSAERIAVEAGIA